MAVEEETAIFATSDLFYILPLTEQWLFYEAFSFTEKALLASQRSPKHSILIAFRLVEYFPNSYENKIILKNNPMTADNSATQIKCQTLGFQRCRQSTSQ